MDTNENNFDAHTGAGAIAAAARDTRRAFSFVILKQDLPDDWSLENLIARKRSAKLRINGKVQFDDKGEPKMVEVVDQVVKIGIVQLTESEELDAVARARGQMAIAQSESVKLAIRFMNGRALKMDELENAWLWSAVGPKGRNLIVTAFREVSQPSDEGVEATLESFSWG